MIGLLGGPSSGTRRDRMWSSITVRASLPEVLVETTAEDK